MKVSVKLVILAAALFTSFLFYSPESFAQNNYKKRVGSISFFPYSPTAINALNDLPLMIRNRVAAHLIGRLGNQFYETLRFTYGVKVDFDDLYRVNPNARSSQWKIFTYKLEFTFSLPAAGISAYEADLWLDGNGDVLKEIDLPDIAHHPEKSKIISFREAREIGKKNMFHATSIELAYDQKADSIVWRLRRHGRDGFTYDLDVSAHTGAVLNHVGYQGISRTVGERRECVS